MQNAPWKKVTYIQEGEQNPIRCGKLIWIPQQSILGRDLSQEEPDIWLLAHTVLRRCDIRPARLCPIDLWVESKCGWNNTHPHRLTHVPQRSSWHQTRATEPRMVAAKNSEIRDLIRRGTFKMIFKEEIPSRANVLTAWFALSIKCTVDGRSNSKIDTYLVKIVML